jgi:hypothetical protein
MSSPIASSAAGTVESAVPSVEVSIGRVEIIADAPPVPASAPSARSGFDEYRALRNYEDWD